MYRILEGLRVIEGSAFVAAPSGGMTLAQLGADVIRFDPIGGGLDARRLPLGRRGESLYWNGLNKGKRSLAVDLRRPEGRELVASLITAPGPGAGLFLSNLPQRRELGYQSLSARRPDLVMLSIVGRRDGSSAVDYTVNAGVGFPYITGAGGEMPVNHALPAWDLLTGSCAALGLLAAERHRARTGRGQRVRLALADVALWATANLGLLAEVEATGRPRPATGNHVYGTFGRDFATGCGRRLMLVAVTHRQWLALVRATDTARAMALLEELLGTRFEDEGARYQARDLIAGVLERWFAAHTLEEAAAHLDAAGACWGPYRDLAQLLAEDPDCSTGNPMFERIEQPGGETVLAPGAPFDFAALERAEVRPAPRLGEHTDEVLGDLLGLSSAAIGRLHDQGVVAGP